MCAMSSFCLIAEDMNPGPHACAARTYFPSLSSRTLKVTASAAFLHSQSSWPAAQSRSEKANHMLHQQGCRKQAHCFLREAPALGNKQASIPKQQLCAQLHLQQVSLKRVKPIKCSNEKAERSLRERPGKVFSTTQGRTRAEFHHAPSPT